MFNKFRAYAARSNTFSSLSAEALEKALAKKPFRPCGSQEMKSLGWSSWDDQSDSLVVTTRLNGKDDHFLLTLKIEERDLKSKVVNEALSKKIAEIEKNEGRKVGRKEKQQLKEEVVQELMPRAMTSSSFVFAWIDAAKGRIIIDQTSDKKCESLLNLLRECLGSLPVVPLRTMEDPIQAMTRWINNKAPKGFSLGESCTLVDAAISSNTVNIKGQDLACDEVVHHIEQGKCVKKLAMAGKDLSFTLDDRMIFSGIRVDESVLQELEESLGESMDDKNAYFEGTFAIVVDATQNLLDQMIDHLGGIYDANAAGDEEEH
ncbi:MAG: recombination-associated protein RdgC [Marinospirillum sp.]|uniref:recombination-associated protein RdgC n=1 Tax=Marinospirillum sp. TaxID=2183934 RepID=UPI0019E24D5A|nr:recombination-associated protein RdgC [Marinospirillum sp.]MBE0506687.1 recombination-associated protein RdgC [Marinospirillum sp.]